MILTVEQRAAGLKVIDEAKRAYLNDLHKERALINAAELFRADGITAWEEVERLKEAIGRMHDHHGVLTDQVVDEVKKHAKSCVEHELSFRALREKLQDALNTLQWYVDASWTKYEDDAGDRAEKALQRIQEEGKNHGDC